jgi:hypothetical protein
MRKEMFLPVLINLQFLDLMKVSDGYRYLG